MLYYSSVHTCVCVCVAVLFFHISRSRVARSLLCSCYFHFIASLFLIIFLWLDFCVCVVIVVDGFHGHQFAVEKYTSTTTAMSLASLTSETFCLVLLPDDRMEKSYARLHVMPVFQPERVTIFTGIISFFVLFCFIFLFSTGREKKEKDTLT